VTVTTTILRSLVRLVLTVLLVLSITFIAVAAPSSRGTMSILYEYVNYVRGVVLLDLGSTGSGVAAEFYVSPALPRSIALVFPPLLVAVLLSVAFARVTYIHRLRWAERRLGWLPAAAYSIPIPFVVVVLTMAAGGFLPPGMSTSVGFAEMSFIRQLFDLVRHLVLPWVTLLIFPLLILMGALTTEVNRHEQSALVTSLVARGYSRREVFRHHLRRRLLAVSFERIEAVFPLVVTYLALVESVFRYTGLGHYLIKPYRELFAGEDVFIVSHAALAYLAVISVVVQSACRLASRLLRRQEAEQTEKGSTSRTIAGVAVVAVLLGFGNSLIPGEAPRIAWLSYAIVALSVVGLLYGFLTHRRRRDAATEPGNATAPVVEVRRPANPENRRAWVRIGALAGLLVVMSVVAWALPPPPELTGWQRATQQAAPYVERLLYHMHLSLYATRGLAPLLAVALAGTLAGLLTAMLTADVGIPMVRPAVALLAVFPAVLLIIVLVRLVGGGTAIIVAFSVIGVVRAHTHFADRLSDLRSTDFMHYNALLGRGMTFRFLWHILPNTADDIARIALVLLGDLVVLRANLRYVGIRFARGLETAAGPPSFLDRAGGVMLGLEWGGLIGAASDGLVRRYYMPIVVPILFLAGVMVAIRALAATTSEVRRV
jgi:ABC-type dipeptide/oligopeptide/nickel transport system permease component/ABC-type dipeptide/oligopeptide/nickel transport system permease subunit